MAHSSEGTPPRLPAPADVRGHATTAAQGAQVPPATVDADATLPPSRAYDSTRAPGGSSRQSGADARAPDGYVIERELGRGGMGVVYLARDIKLNRRCALKMILAGSHSSSTEIDRFLTEAQAIARLQHPGIVQVFEIGEYEGKPFMALEFCDGGSLDGKLRKNPLKPTDAAKLVRQLARAMQAAHDSQVIHRDLKPANVLLATVKGPSGKVVTPKITDFGLAKKLDEHGATRTGSVMGTPSYMPPEQADGRKDVGPAADIYALGAILYECLTGRPPFKAATALDTVLQVVTQEPVPVRQLNPQAPMDLETIAHKCLQKDPKKRYGTALELADDLGRHLAGESIRARPVGTVERAVKWVRRNVVLSVAAALVLLTLTAGAVVSSVYARMASNEAKAAREAEGKADEEAKAALSARANESAALLKTRRQITRLDLLQANRLADNRQFDEALLAIEKGWQSDPDPENEGLHRLRAGLALQARPRLVGLAIHDAPLIDAVADLQGTRVLTRTTTGTAGLWDIRAGRAVQPDLPHGSKVATVAISGDGRFAITGGDNQQVCVWDANSGQLRHRLNQGAGVECVAFRPGETVFASVGTNGLKFWRAEDGTAARPPIDAPRSYVVSFSANGERLATANQDGLAQVWDFTTGQALGKPVPHAIRTELQRFEHIRRGPVLTPDGKRLLTSTGEYPRKTYSLACTEVETGKPVWQTPYGTSGVNWQAFSPDGRRVTGSHSKSHLRDLATGQLLANFDTPRESQFATFLGNERVAASSTGGSVQIWNAVPPYAITDWKIQAAEGVRSLSALPDGEHFLMACGDGTARLYRLPEPAKVDPNLGGRANRRRLPEVRNGRAFRFSPDGGLECTFGNNQPLRYGPRGQANWPFVIDTPTVNAWFSDDGHTILASAPMALRAWSVKTAQPLGPEVALGGTNTLSMSRDARRVALAESNQRVVKVVDMTTGGTLLQQTYPPHFEPTSGYPTLDAAGRRLACNDFAYGGAVEIWDLERKVRLHRLNPHRGVLNHLQLSTDGNILLVCSSDTTARLWDAASGQPLGPFLRHSAFCRYGAIAEDGRTVVTSDGNGVIQLWDGRTGDRLGTWGPFEKGYPRVWFARDEKTIFAEFQNGIVRSFELGAYRGRRETLQPVLQLLTGLRIDPETQGIEPLPADHFQKAPERFLEAWRQFKQ